MEQHVTPITRKRIRELKVIIDLKIARRPMHIISTYAPQIGHRKEAGGNQCQEVEELHDKTCVRRVIIWRAAENGKIKG